MPALPSIPPRLPAWMMWLRDRLPSLYLTRFSFILAILLLAYGPFAQWVLPSLFQSTLVLEPSGILRVAFTSTLSAFVVMTTRRVIVLYGPDRFLRSPRHRVAARLSLAHVFGYSILALPVMAFVLVDSRAEAPMCRSMLAAAGGIALGWLALVVVHVAQSAFVSPGRVLPDALLPGGGRFTQWLRRSDPLGESLRGRGPRFGPRWRAFLGPGYLESDGALLPNHALSIALLALYVVWYLWYYVTAKPGTPKGSVIPTIVCVLVLSTLWTWLLAGVAFFLDRHRVPTLALVAIWSYGVSWVGHSDHYFLHQPLTPVTLPSPVDVVKTRGAGPIVVYAADGGGIQAAAWNAQVLTGIQERWPAFTQSLRLVSSVSGGSVGAMYFLGEVTRAGGPADPGHIRALATRSSLNEAAWGLAYPDFWRALLPIPPSLRFVKDRGWALETAWARDWSGAGQTLAEWGRDANEGWRPAVAFNSTAVEQGHRFLMASFSFPPEWDAHSFFETYPGRDIRIATAARLSAAFPYVSPVARAWPDTDKRTALHFADAGYYDNSGMLTALQWINQVVMEKPEILQRRPVVLIQGVSAADFRGRDPYDRTEWFQLTAPIETMLNVRQAGQLERVTREYELVREFWLSHGIDVQLFKFQFERRSVPLSWRLSAPEIAAIGAEWGSSCNPARLDRLLVVVGAEASPSIPKAAADSPCRGNY
ncbi:MAG TPA: hypothetical protein VEL79_11655 [Vicinamibacterales bacterium]|nr:hypothetical protein [Vicinamibacterales bacterium]